MDATDKAKGLQMLKDRLGLEVPPDDPMASAAAAIELANERLWAAKERQWAEEDRLAALRESADQALSASTTAASPAPSSAPGSTAAG